MQVVLSSILIIAGLVSLLFPQYSSFFFKFEKTSKGWKFKDDYQGGSARHMSRRIKGVVFILVGLLFLSGAVNK